MTSFSLFISENFFHIQFTLGLLLLSVLFLIFNRYYKATNSELYNKFNITNYILISLFFIIIQLYCIIDICYTYSHLSINTPYSKLNISTYTLILLIILLNFLFLFFRNSKLFSLNYELLTNRTHFYYAILTAYLIMISILIEANNFFLILLSLEAQAILTYSLIAVLEKINYNQLKSFFMFLVISTLSSLLIWLGYISFFSQIKFQDNLNLLLELQTNKINNFNIFAEQFNLIQNYTLNLNPLTHFGKLFMEQFNLFELIPFLIIIGLLQKLGATPFSFWIRQVYTSLPTPALAFININHKIIYFYILILVLKYLVTMNIELIHYIFLIIGFFCLFFGTITVLYQKNIKEFLICSSIPHIGYILIILSFYNLDDQSLYFSWAYLFNYTLTTTLIWSIISTNEIEEIDTLDSSNLKMSYFLMTDLQVIAKQPLKAFLLIILLFSLAGLPPFIGFFFKYSILLTFLQTNINHFLFFICILLIGVFSTYYYLKLSVNLYIHTIQTYKLTSLFSNTKNKILILLNLSFIFLGPLYLFLLLQLIEITNLSSL